ncbi:dynamin family protein [Sulfoacidibacillus ferrooxidans]|uniref:GTPase Der n=1 Tax=Sulfoacidibacillus ferrooxidans TaxID=2005001 RepID=A0A9X1V7W2_9BACL|nr:GTPase Der [Sulfoacidibacillus ferrooxidans]
MPTDEVTKMHDLTGLLPIVHRLRSSFATKHDEERVERSDLIAQKWMNGQVVLAFAGHFSAGKSTLINTILDVSLLPSSPLPTSANVVHVEYGYPHAEALTANGDVIEISDLSDEIGKLCRDGDRIDEVRIYDDIPYLQDGFVLIDTPGVDSTDPRHAEHTHQIVYLADLIVYVADYNHVLSDMNLSFLRKQIDMGKRVVLVVNQIDKHNDFELSFDEFKAGIERALEEWQIASCIVYYVSALDPEFPDNQLVVLRDQLPELARSSQTFERGAADLQSLIAEHDAWLIEQDNLSSQEMSLATARQVLDQYQIIEKQMEEERTKKLERVQAFVGKLTSTIMQAIIMPYETTELAVAYIESLSDHFKVGLFSTAAKVEAERQRRLKTFLADVKVRVESGIELHMKQAAMQVARDEGVLTTLAGDGFASLEGFGDESLMESCIAQGARRDREYGYQYAKHVEQSIRDHYVMKAHRLGKDLESGLTEKFALEQRELTEQLAELHSTYEVALQVVEMATKREQWIASLRALLIADEQGEGK